MELRRAEPPVEAARLRQAEARAAAVRRHTEIRYGAKSWKCERRVAARIEATPKGLDIRYVVTNLAAGSAAWLYETMYCARGQMENCIKLHKTQLHSDRTSCRSPLANQVRLVLHTAAYWLLLMVRDHIPKLQPLAIAEFKTLQHAPDQDRRAHHRDRHAGPHRLRRRLPRAPSCSAASCAASSPPGPEPRGLAPEPAMSRQPPAPATSVPNCDEKSA